MSDNNPDDLDVDPSQVVTRADFGRALTRARLRSGLTVRDLAQRASIAPATLGGYLSGRHLPLPTQSAAVLRLLGALAIDDTRSWLQALERARATSDGRAARAPSPYRGLEPFQPEDADWFFGRDAATRAVLDALGEHPVIAVVGASGSGKSSLLRAGVVPALVRAGRFAGSVLTPGTTTAAALAHALRAGPGVVVVDQFEEVFTALTAAERAQFLAALTAGTLPAEGSRPADGAQPADGRPTGTRVVLGLRADFYAAAAREPTLVGILQDCQVLLAPMTREELREAIVGPAARANIAVEEALVDVLLADLTPRAVLGAAHEPGALPLLSHTLFATWERAPRNQLTVADYRATGGISGAVQQTAEQLYASLEPADQLAARRMFIRLTNVDEDGVLTRRRVTRAELDEAARGAGSSVADRFVAARLLTAADTTVEVSHEALLTAWPRLRDWLDDDREAIRQHRRITEAANAWSRADRDPDLLLRAAQLEAVRDALGLEDAAGAADLNDLERAYVQASEQQRQADALAERRRRRSMRALLAAVAVVAVVAASLAAYAFHARAQATAERDRAAAARNDDLSGKTSLEAIRLRDTSPSLAAQLALTAYGISATEDARSAVLDASAFPAATRIRPPQRGAMQAVAMSGNLLAATVADGTVHLWSVADAGHPLALGRLGRPSDATLFALAINPTGTLLATGGGNHAVQLWDVHQPRAPHLLSSYATTGTVFGLSFTPDGSQLAAADSDGLVLRWQVTPGGTRALPRMQVPGVELHAVTFDPSGQHLAAAGSNGFVAEWALADLPTGTASTTGTASSATHAVSTTHPSTHPSKNPSEHSLPAMSPAPMAVMSMPAADVALSAAFSPDGSTIAVGYKDAVVRLWRAGHTATTPSREFDGAQSWINAVAWHNDTELAAGSSDNTVAIWNLRTGTKVGVLPHQSAITSVTYSADGTQLVTAELDGAVHIWPADAPSIGGAPGSIFGLAYSADSSELAVVASGATGVQLWRPGTPREYLGTAALPPTSDQVIDGAGSMSGDGHLVAAGTYSGEVELWDAADPSHPALLAPLVASHAAVESVNFSADGTLLAVSGDDRLTEIWSVADPRHPRLLARLGGFTNVAGWSSFSPDGRYLVAVSWDHTALLWDVSDPRHPVRLARLTGMRNYGLSAAFSPDSTLVAIGSADQKVRLWNLADPHRPVLQATLIGQRDAVYSVAFAPGGRTLYAAGKVGGVVVWDLSTPSSPREIERLIAAPNSVFAVAVRPDGNQIAIGGADRTAFLEDTRVAAVQAQDCASIGTPITRAEWREFLPDVPYDAPCRR